MMGLEEEVIFLMSMVAMELASSKPAESWASSFKVYTEGTEIMSTGIKRG